MFSGVNRVFGVVSRRLGVIFGRFGVVWGVFGVVWGVSTDPEFSCNLFTTLNFNKTYMKYTQSLKLLLATVAKSSCVQYPS